MEPTWRRSGARGWSRAAAPRLVQRPAAEGLVPASRRAPSLGLGAERLERNRAGALAGTALGPTAARRSTNAGREPRARPSEADEDDQESGGSRHEGEGFAPARVPFAVSARRVQRRRPCPTRQWRYRSARCHSKDQIRREDVCCRGRARGPGRPSARSPGSVPTRHPAPPAYRLRCRRAQRGQAFFDVGECRGDPGGPEILTLSGGDVGLLCGARARGCRDSSSALWR